MAYQITLYNGGSDESYLIFRDCTPSAGMVVWWHAAWPHSWRNMATLLGGKSKRRLHQASEQMDGTDKLIFRLPLNL